VPMMMMS